MILKEEMKNIKNKKGTVLLLTTLIILTIAGCNFPRIDKDENLDPTVPTINSHETGSNTENPIRKSRIEAFALTMPQLGNRQRNIQVYLPPNYDASNSSYPVLYFFDGDSLFDPPPERVGDYLVDETLDELFEKKLTDGVIVVGIEYDPNNLWSEYMPWVNSTMRDWLKARDSKPTEGGEGEMFLNFIIETLKPEIDSRYRTLPDRDNTAIGGSCRYALIPLYAGLTRPDVFSKVMMMSPAVWLADGGGSWLSNNQLIEFIENTEAPTDVRIYLDIGTEESSGPQPKVFDQDGKRLTYPQAYVEGAEQVYLALLTQGFPIENLRFVIIEGAAGTRDEWAKRFGSAFLWMIQTD